jgi:NAD(P)-dependent dehydrogenase (short-subunit alcohol dehydrogenase family)
VDLKLNGKKALVTGSTQGIGRAIALGLAQEGARVVVTGRTEGGVSEAVAALTHEVPGAQVEGFSGDLGTESGTAALIKAHPRFDIVVNNLGIFEPQDFLEIPDETWRRFFEVNVLSGVRLSRAYLPGMRAQNWGRLVFISSESAVQIPTEMIHYGMTKTAQLAVSRGIAETLAGTGVTCNAVLPGPTRSQGVVDFVHKMSGGQSFEAAQEEFFRTARPSSLLKRFAEPAEVANLVVYLCGEGSSATNGAALRVDGGVVRSMV